MRVRFSEISPVGSRYEIREIEGLSLQQDFVVRGPVEAQCTLKRKGDAKVELYGSLKVSLSLPCDRCLSLYDVEVDADLHVIFETESGGSWQVKELECNIPDLDTVVLDEPVIDLDDVLRQQLYLALPVKSLCSEQCRGICSQCGANLNLAACNCADQGKKSPFSVLAQLKK